MSFQVPQKYRAFTADEKAKGSVKEVSAPSLGDNDVFVKVEYAAQNPTDWKHLSFFSPPGAIIGGDVAGTVVAVGANPRSALKVGDKVAGIVHGNLYTEQGAFAEYTRAQSDMLFKIPEGMSAADASTFGVAWVTVLQALIHSQGAQWPPAKVEGEPWYLVYGGSTSVGLFALQVARILGYKPIAVASPRNFDLVKSYGAEHVVDYHDPEKTVEEIKRVTGGGVKIGLDTISEGNSFGIAAKSFAPGGGRLNAILWPTDEDKAIRKDVEIVTTLMYTLFGHAFTTFGRHYEVIPEDYKFGQEIAARTADLITKYNIRANPIEIRGGLEAVQDGLDFQKAGKVSAKKLVYKIAQ